MADKKKTDLRETRLTGRVYATVRELTEWRRWVADGSEKYRQELLKLSAWVGESKEKGGLTQPQREALTRMRDGLERLEAELKKFEKESRRFKPGVMQGKAS